MTIARRARPASGLAAFALAAAVAACGGGSLSDAAYSYCVNEAPAAELDAAAEALNIAPDADRDFETNRDRTDPTFQRVCEYAYDARGRDVDGDAGQPAEESASAPLDPQRSEDASLPAASASP